MKDTKTRWILIAIVAALVAVITTTLVLVLRARAKKKARYDEECFEYDVEDCDCIADDQDGAAADSNNAVE